MTHTYNVAGMTCKGCQAKVHSLLSKVAGVQDLRIDLEKGEVQVDMSKHIATKDLQVALKEYPKYQLSEINHSQHTVVPVIDEQETQSWLMIYRPVLLIFGYITVITFLIEYIGGSFEWARWLNHFMAGFFLVFSFSNYLT